MIKKTELWMVRRTSTILTLSGRYQDHLQMVPLALTIALAVLTYKAPELVGLLF